MPALIAAQPNVRAQSGYGPFIAATGMWTTQPHYVVEMNVKRGRGHGIGVYFSEETHGETARDAAATRTDHTASMM
jgi:hypothetical protein